MDRLATLTTRIDPPSRWDDADRYELKRQFRADDVTALIDRVVAENMTIEQTDGAIESLQGRTMADPPKVEVADLTGAADAMAKKVMEAIVNQDIDGARFLATLQTSLVSFGYELAKSHDDRGVTVYKLVKTGR